VTGAGAPTLGVVPNKPATPLRNFRIPDNEYQAAQAKAQQEGTNLTTVVRELLRTWVDKTEE
jgi:predicted HicB family RNase H-like nuclease